MADSDITVTGAELSSGENGYTYSSNLLSGSNLTFRDSVLSGGKRGINIGNAENGTIISVQDSEITGTSTGLVATLNKSSLNINNSVLKGSYGMSLYGADSDIAMTNSRTEGLFLRGHDMEVNISHSDAGFIQVSGQGATEENNYGGNTFNINSSKLTAFHMNFGEYGFAGDNTVNISGSEINSDSRDVEDAAAIQIQDVNNNTVNVKDSVVKGN
ncbi:hypothetical protein, partial [Salmonella enterica]